MPSSRARGPSFAQEGWAVSGELVGAVGIESRIYHSFKDLRNTLRNRKKRLSTQGNA